MAALENELPDPADELSGDIEAAIEQQEKGLAEPVDEPVEDKAEGKETETAPERDEKGRFKPKAEAAEPSEPPAAAQDKPPVEPAPEAAAPAQNPPSGFSVASKAAWDDLPQHVRDDIAKREQDIEAGFRRYTGLARFAEAAERNGTTLQNAVSDYVAVETELDKNFFGGIEYLCQRYASRLGVHPQALLQGLGQRYGAAPAGERQPHALSSQTTSPPIDPQAIANYVASMVRTETQQREIDSQIAVFGADPKNKYFPNLRKDMGQIVQAGKATTLQEAYEAACWLNPEIRAILINEANGGKDKQAAATASRSRNAAKAIGGSPASGANPDGPGKRQRQSIDDDIDAAIAAQVDAA